MDAGLSCVLGIGSDAWDRLFRQPRPVELHPFREIRAPGRHAVATPGDLLFHIRAQHFDLCFELGTQIVARLGDAIWAPAIAGAFVLSTRGGDFQLHIGEDVSIGYSGHSETVVRLYLQETITFLLLTKEAAVALAPGKGSS